MVRSRSTCRSPTATTSRGCGPRTITVDNASSPLPFGAVDTPASGQTVSGTITVHGWALTPGTAMIPVDGSTIDVIVDGAVVGHPTYNQARPDVQALFPGYTNSAAPGDRLCSTPDAVQRFADDRMDRSG